MTLHNEDTIKMELASYPPTRPVQPALSQEERLARRSLLAICLVGLVGYIVWVEVVWPVLLALMVMHSLVR